MFRILQAAALVFYLLGQLPAVQAGNTYFWLSTQDYPSASPVPTLPTQVPEFSNFAGQTSGSIYIWGRPAPGETLKNWSLNLYVDNGTLLTSMSSQVYNPSIGEVARWQEVAQPNGSSTLIKNIAGFSQTNEGVGIDEDTSASDPLFVDAYDAWLLAKVNYSLPAFTSFKTANLYLQVGSLGMTDSGGNSSTMSVVLGHSGETALNASSQRQTNSVARDGYINFYPTPDADFDGDTDVDGRDFLIWQRKNPTASGATNANGNATYLVDGAVNGADLAAWQYQYGTTVFPTLVDALHVVPEPSSLFIATFVGCWCLSRRQPYNYRQDFSVQTKRTFVVSEGAL